MFFKLVRKCCLSATFYFFTTFSLYSMGGGDNFFANSAIHSYIAVAGIQEYASPKISYRVGVGYHLFMSNTHSFQFSLNTGQSFISGTNPLVRTLDLIPLYLLAQYEFSPFYFVSFNAGLGTGMFFSNVSRYKTAIDMIQNEISSEKNVLPFVQANLGASLKVLKNSVNICLDFGIDLLPENEGPIPLPYFCVSIKFFPLQVLKFTKFLKNESGNVKKIVEYPQEVNSFTKIYFSENSWQIQDEYFPILDYFALYLKGYLEKNQNEQKNLSIVLTGYSAPFGSEDSQDDIAEQRAQNVMEYICSKSGIKSDSFVIRLKSSNFDIPSLPQEVTNIHLQKYRLVEINVIEKSKLEELNVQESNANENFVEAEEVLIEEEVQ